MRDAKIGKSAAWGTSLGQYLDQPVGERTLSSYLTGQNVPNADVFLAAVKAAGLRLDEYLYGESILARLDRLESSVDELRKNRRSGSR